MALQCRCLNITVDPAGAKLQPVSEMDLPVPDVVKASFGDGKYGCMVPECISIKFPFMIRTISSEVYTLYTCSNCSTTACAVNRDGNTVLLSSQLLDEKNASEVKRSEDYSAVYGIVVECCGTAADEITNAGATSSSPASASTIMDLRHQFDSFILMEETKMKNDIRSYEAVALEKYSLIRDAADKQFHQLCRIAQIAWAKGSKKEENGGPHQQSMKEEGSAALYTSQSKGAKNEVDHYTRNKVTAQAPRRSISNTDTLFDLDEDVEDELCDPYGCSDDDGKCDDDTTTDSGIGSGKAASIAIATGQQQGWQQASRLSTSAAMPIPSAMRRRKSQAGNSDSDELNSDDEEHMPDIKDMGASIKALAQSVGYDGTEMFGDLPRPRLNTHDRLLM